MSDSPLDIAQSIDAYIGKISEGHRMHRKIKFLLDIRGLLVINKLEGDYVEFGVFRGEMMYAAAKILAPRIKQYIGLDTFTGLPKPQEKDKELFVFESEGFMASPKEFAAEIMQNYKTALIEGDFRDSAVQNRFSATAGTISVLAIDCNWPSSVEAAVNISAPLLQNGSIVYFDDYFVATRHPNFNEPIMERAEQEHGIKFVEFMTYPPCARAFLAEHKEKNI